jgi:phosphoribosylcarboxyaminoimidazole (NCAIR) mutase
VGSVVTIEPEGAAIAAAKIFALQDEDLAKRLRDYQQSKKREVERTDESVKKLK